MHTSAARIYERVAVKMADRSNIYQESCCDNDARSNFECDAGQSDRSASWRNDSGWTEQPAQLRR